LCLAYGGDPLTFQEFIDRGWLPKKRADHCDQEFTQLKLAFANTVLPFIDQELMARVQQTQWLTADELK
jgi:Putative metallopeptidase